jgi:hypothetical protein
MSRTILVQYRKRLLVGSGLILITILPLLYVQPYLAYLLVSIWTVFHVVFQQTGLSQMYMKHRSPYYDIWKWSIGLLACYIYIMFYPSIVHALLIPYKDPILLVATPILVLLTVLVMKGSKTSRGMWYSGATGSLIIASAVSFFLGYHLLAILIPRIVHDVTAFTFYIVHGMNSSADTSSDSIFRSLYLPYFMIPIIILGLSLGLGYLLTQGIAVAATIPIIFFVSLMHYFTDGFAWKRDSLLRKQIRFS